MSCISGFMDDVIFAHKPRLLDVAAQLKRSAHAAFGLAIDCAVILVAGQRTHGTTFRALRVTSQVATPKAESAVYDCLVVQLRCSRLAAVDLLHQKDYAIRCLCDDKFNASLELLELFAKDELFGGVSTTPRSPTFSFFCRLQRSI